MSAAKSEFVWVKDPEDVCAPTADRLVDPPERVEAFAYESGHVELRSALPGEFINTTKPVHTSDFR